MGLNATSIQWTWATDPATGALIPNSGSTYNPLKGCRRVSPGCGGAAKVGGCYAERLIATRLVKMPMYQGLARMTPQGPRFTGEHRVDYGVLDAPLRTRKGRKVFVNDMGDLFFEGHLFEEIAIVFGVMAAAEQHTFQVLTKRAKRMEEFFQWVSSRPSTPGSGPGATIHPFAFCTRAAGEHVKHPALSDEYNYKNRRPVGGSLPWPLPNLWLGVSTEDQQRANERIPHLLRCPAVVRFLSVEPQIGPIDLEDMVTTDGSHELHRSALFCDVAPEDDEDRSGASVDLVIVGGESGPGARPFQLEWARSLMEQCRASSTAFFMKQWGAHPMLDGNRITLADGHGGEMGEWEPYAPDLMVREFPKMGSSVKA